jgi:hypothetical protein
MTGWMRPLLDTSASVAMLAAAGVLIWTLIAAPAPPQSPVQAPPPYQVGEVVEPLAGVGSLLEDRLPTENVNAVLVVRSSCTYCTASMPF